MSTLVAYPFDRLFLCSKKFQIFVLRGTHVCYTSSKGDFGGYKRKIGNPFRRS